MSHLNLLQDVFGGNWIATAAVSAAATVVLWVAYELCTWYFCLRGVPGPFRNSVSNHLKLIVLGYRGDLYKWERKMHDKYGDLFRIGPYHVIINDPDVFRRINSGKSQYIKSAWYPVLAKFTKGVDSTLSLGSHGQIDTHHNQHITLSPSYTGKNNFSPSAEEVMDAQIATLVSLLSTKYVTPSGRPSRPCNFAILGQYVMLDIISALLWSESFGFLQQDHDIGSYIQTLEEFLPIRSAIGALPIMPYLRPLLHALLPTDADKTGLGRLHGIGKAAIDARLADMASGKSVPQDILTSFISQGLTGRSLYAEVYMVIAAGSDNPATLLRLILISIITSPASYNKLVSEILSSPLSSPATDAEIKKLPYLQSVIRETLRVFPTPAELYKEVPSGGDTISGHFLPGGTWVGVNLHSMTRRKDVFGDDADVFRPERWLEEVDQEKLRKMVNVVELTFSSGRFICLGRAVGLMEVGKGVCELLRHFDFAAADPQKALILEGYGLYLIREQMVYVTKREGVKV